VLPADVKVSSNDLTGPMIVCKNVE